MLIYQHNLPRSMYIINYHRAKNARIPLLCKLIVIYLCSKQISKSKTICDSVLNASKFFYFRKEEKKQYKYFFHSKKRKKLFLAKKSPNITAILNACCVLITFRIKPVAFHSRLVRWNWNCISICSETME